MNNYIRIAIFDAAAIFFLLAISLYHFMIYLGRRKEQTERRSLFFSFFSLSLGLNIFMGSKWVFYLLSDTGENYKWFLKSFNELIYPILITLSGVIFCISYLLYFQNTFERKSRPFLTIVTSVVLLLNAVFSFFPLIASTSARLWRLYYLYFNFMDFISSLVFQLFLILPFLYYLFIFFREKKWKDRSISAVMLGAFILISYTFTLFLFRELSHKNINYLNTLAIPAALLYAYALACRFNQDFYDVKNLKNNLEHLVDQRTRELAEARDQLIILDKRKTESYLTLAHETRTPLTLIQYAVGNLHVQRDSEEELDLLRQNISKLQSDMLNFLDTEKIQQGDLLYNHTLTVLLSDIIEKQARSFEDLNRGKGLQYNTSIDPDICIKGDVHGLERILSNLLMNAHKYTSEGEISLSLKTRDSQAVLTVENSGGPLTPEQCQRIFEPYFRSDDKRESTGYGLGLTITRQIVEEMNGTIKAECKDSRNVIFTVTWPLLSMGSAVIIDELQKSESKSFPRDYNRRIPEITGPRPLILVVEDNPDLRNILKKELEKQFQVETARSGREAIKVLGYIPVPELILSDVMMDDGDGEFLYEQLIRDSRYSSVPFIFLTALDNEKKKIDLISRGAVGFVHKPFSFAELTARIHSLMEFSKRSRTRVIQDAITVLNGQLTAEKKSPDENRMSLFRKKCEEYKITDRQQDIILMISEGLQYKEIAGEINISERTVTRHVQNIYEKLDVHNKVEMLNLVFS